MKTCKWCGSTTHTQFYCRLKRNKAIPKAGRRSTEYADWRDNVAYPFLVDTFGEKCASCGKAPYICGALDVDHIQKRGSNPALKMRLDNVQLLCRYCHIRKDNALKRSPKLINNKLDGFLQHPEYWMGEPEEVEDARD